MLLYGPGLQVRGCFAVDAERLTLPVSHSRMTSCPRMLVKEKSWVGTKVILMRAGTKIDHTLSPTQILVSFAVVAEDGERIKIREGGVEVSGLTSGKERIVIRFACPACTSVLTAPDHTPGQQFACLQCGRGQRPASLTECEERGHACSRAFAGRFS